MLHAHFSALCVIDAELLVMEFSQICAGMQVSVARVIDGCGPFCSCDLDLDPIYDLDPYSQEMHLMCRYELPVSRLSGCHLRDIQTKSTEIINYAAWWMVNNNDRQH